MGIKVMIALSNSLFADGVKKFFDSERDIDVVDVLKAGKSCDNAVRANRPDIVLVDFMTLYNGFRSTLPNSGTRFILFDTTCGDDNIESAVNSKGICGVLPSNTNAARLKKAVRTVAKGELFLGKKAGEARSANLKKKQVAVKLAPGQMRRRA